MHLNFLLLRSSLFNGKAPRKHTVYGHKGHCSVSVSARVLFLSYLHVLGSWTSFSIMHFFRPLLSSVDFTRCSLKNALQSFSSIKATHGGQCQCCCCCLESVVFEQEADSSPPHSNSSFWGSEIRNFHNVQSLVWFKGYWLQVLLSVCDLHWGQERSLNFLWQLISSFCYYFLNTFDSFALMVNGFPRSTEDKMLFKCFQPSVLSRDLIAF